MPDSVPLVAAKPRAILDAAAALFMRQGFAGTSMDAVAREANVSKATLYAHFAGKDALFAAVVARRCEAMAKEAATRGDHERPPEETLPAVARAILEFFLSPETLALFRVVVAEATRSPGLAAAFFAAGPLAGRQRLADWIAEERRRGRLREHGTPEEAADRLLAMLSGEMWKRALLALPPAPEEGEIAREAARAAEDFLRLHAAMRPAQATVAP
jgi:TetR/AcrR family transcriptional repressor of mexJK operon